MDNQSATERSHLLEKQRDEAPKLSFKDALKELLVYKRDYSVLITMAMLSNFPFTVMMTVLPLYLTTQWDFSDFLAGLCLGNFGLMIGVLSVYTGILPSRVGAKPALCIASVAAAAGMVVISVGPGLLFVMLSLYLLVAGGTSLQVPIILCLTKLYIPPECRLVSNVMLSGAVSASILLSSIVISVFWDIFNDDYWAFFGIYALGGFLAIISSILSYVLGKPQFATTTEAHKESTMTFSEASKHPTFMPFVIYLGLLTINLGFNGLFVVILPMYMTRELGEDSDWATILLVVALTSLVTVIGFSGAVMHVKHYNLIAYGCVIQSLAPAMLLLPATELRCAGAGVLFGIGTIYIPRMFDYIAEVAPLGYEAIYLSLSNVPTKGSLFLKGLISGLLIGAFLPEDGERQAWILWLIVFVGSMVSALFLFIFRGYLELKPAKVTKEAEEEQDQENVS